MVSPFFIVGPTAVGKTGLAMAVAERCGAEIVNADAFQVYDGLDLLTAKPSAEERHRVTHHLVGTVPLRQAYNVARYLDEARRCLDDIARRSRPAIVVGGSGMYIKALTHGLSPLPGAQPELRAELEALGEAVLLRRLRLLDPVSANAIDPRNKRRLIRAIEVCETTGQCFSNFLAPWYANIDKPAICGVMLVRNKAELDARIQRRVDLMFSHGVIDEVHRVRCAPLSDTASRMIGLEQIGAHLDGKLERTSCIDRVQIATRQYAKRQTTWFKREKMFESVVLTGEVSNEPVVQSICERILSAESPSTKHS